MAEYHKTDGFILLRRESREADLTCDVFTKEFGLLSVQAVSARKIASKLRPALEPFSLSHIEFVRGRSRIVATSASVIRPHNELHVRLHRMQAAHRIAEATRLFVRFHGKDARVWELLCAAFSDLTTSNGDRHSSALVYYRYFWNLMDSLGYRPELDRCALCGTSTPGLSWMLADKEEGIVCASCASPPLLSISSSTISCIKSFLGNKEVERASLSELTAISRRFGSRHIVTSRT